MSEIKDATFNEVADVHLRMITKKTSYKDREYIHKLKPFIGGIHMSELIRPKEININKPVYPLNKYVLKRSKDHVTANTVNKELSILNTIGKKAVRFLTVLRLFLLNNYRKCRRYHGRFCKLLLGSFLVHSYLDL